MKAEVAVEVMQRLQESEPREGLREVMLAEGQGIRQGDVYVWCVPANWPRGAVRVGESARVLGTGTAAGARHIAEPPAVVHEGKTLPDWIEMPSGGDPAWLVGPVVVAMPGEPWMMPHPEHSPFRVRSTTGVCQITYQYDPSTMRRVVD